jgi:MraZ protein
MVNFQGGFESKIDAKYRTVLPARLKACLPESENKSIVLTRGQEPCITIFPLSVWETIYQKVIHLDKFSAEARKFQRTYLMGSFTVELDAQGRFVVPKMIANYAQLEGEYMMLGLGDRIEMWNPTLLEQNQFSDPQEFSDATEKILGEKKPYSFDVNLFKN